MRLHVRARHLDLVAAALLVLTVAGALAAHWLATRAFFDGACARVPVAVLVPLAAAVLVSTTVAGADVDLETSMPRLTRRWRAGHGLVVALVAAAAVALCATSSPAVFGSAALFRNTLGLTGLVLLAAAVLPADACWAPVVGYGLTTYLAAPHQPDAASIWWAWPMPPGGLDGSWVVALLALGGGVLAHAARGPLRR